MNFQSLPVVESPQEIVERAFTRAKKRAAGKGKAQAISKITIVQDNIVRTIERIITEFPDFSNLNDFYEELCKTQVSLDDVRNALGRLQGITSSIRKLSSATSRKIREEEESEVKKSLKKHYGRISSTLKRAEDAFTLLEKTRTILSTFPAIKEGLFTVALAGFPNVGKSTLLSKITTARPKIANYAFTTKTLNIGYYKEGFEKIQVIDTPGTLARYEKMNRIEQQAYLCLKYVAEVIIMIIDPTETYGFEQQLQLLKEIEEHDKPIIIYVSKTDVAEEKQIKPILKKFPEAITKPEELLSIIGKMKKEGVV